MGPFCRPRLAERRSAPHGGGSGTERTRVGPEIEGRRLAEPVRDAGGSVLLAEGTVLRQVHVDFLARQGVSRVAVHQADPDGMQLVPTLDDLEHRRGVAALAEAFGTCRARRETLLHQALQFGREVLCHAGPQRRPPGRFPFREYTLHHSVEVGLWSRLLAQELGLDEAGVEETTLAGLLHDLGKCRVPSEVLHKDRQLDPEEWQLVRQHPSWGADACRKGGLRGRRILQVILQHHERMDGAGYPLGLKGEEICLGARAVAVADAFSAITSYRDYRGRKLPVQAVEELQREEGHYDPEVLAAFWRLLSPYREGDAVCLADGSRGRVLRPGENPYEPWVETSDGRRMRAAAPFAVVGWAA